MGGMEGERLGPYLWGLLKILLSIRGALEVPEAIRTSGIGKRVLTNPFPCLR